MCRSNNLRLQGLFAPSSWKWRHLLFETYPLLHCWPFHPFKLLLDVFHWTLNDLRFLSLWNIINLRTQKILILNFLDKQIAFKKLINHHCGSLSFLIQLFRICLQSLSFLNRSFISIVCDKKFQSCFIFEDELLVRRRINFLFDIIYDSPLLDDL